MDLLPALCLTYLLRWTRHHTDFRASTAQARDRAGCRSVVRLLSVVQ